MEQRLAELEAAMESGEEKSEHHALDYARLAIGVGRYRDVQRVTEPLVERDSGNVRARVLLATTHALRGRPDETLALLEPELAAGSTDSGVSALAGTALVVQGAAVGGILNPTRIVKRALTHFDAARENEPEAGVAKVESLLHRGRILTLLPSTFNRRDEGIEATGALPGDPRGSRPRRARRSRPWWPFSASMATSSSARPWPMRGEIERAEEHWDRVILADPRSNFAEIVYSEAIQLTKHTWKRRRVDHTDSPCDINDDAP